jgi:hypothetical protein
VINTNSELEKGEITFFNAYEKVIDGKNISTSDKVKIRDYILNRHSVEINELNECDYSMVFRELKTLTNNLYSTEKRKPTKTFIGTDVRKNTIVNSNSSYPGQQGRRNFCTSLADSSYIA